MESSCPDCGAGAGFVERTARVLHGTCAGCGRTFTIVQEETPAPALVPADAPSPPLPAETTPPPPEPPSFPPPPPPGPACAVCGAALALRSSSDTSFDARCGSCGTAFTYVLATPLATPPAPPSPAPVFARRPPSREDRRGPPASRARPCRECGGPLRFTTGPDGNITGECGSCGNRFTLPPRRPFGPPPGRRGNRREPDRPFPPAFRRQDVWSRGSEGERPQRYRGSIGAVRRRDRRRDSDEDEENGRRRRRGRRN